MNNESKNTRDKIETIPLGQKLFDNPFILLAAGLVVMFVFYTLWGLYELISLPKGTLP